MGYIKYDKDKLEKLLNSFHEVAGIKFGIFDTDFTEIITASHHSEFCRLIQDSEIGLKKCLECDAQTMERVKKENALVIYRCHAGLIEAISPINESGEFIAYVSFGQILDDSLLSEQWENTRAKCSWHHDLDKLRESFYKLITLSNNQIKAYAEIVSACTVFIWLKRIIKTAQQTDEQKLASFIDQNYSRGFTLQELADHLMVSKTKVCMIAQKTFGTTVRKMLIGKRIEAAKILLESTTLSITEISESIGYSDYNYFGKQFKSLVNVSPTQYRKTL